MLLKLLKIQFLAFFSGFSANLRNRGKVARVLMVLALIYCVLTLIFAFGGMFFSLAEPLHEMGMDNVYFALSALISFSICFFTDLFIVKARIYEAKDNELLLAMPLTPRLVLTARLLCVIAFNWLLCLATALVPLLVHFVCLGFSAPLLLRFLPAFLALPLLPSVLGGLLSLVLVFVERRVRKKQLVTTVLSLAFLAVYFPVMSRMNDILNHIMVNSQTYSAKLKLIFPIWFFGTGVTGNLGELALYVAISLGIFLLATLLLSRSFAGLALSVGAVRGKARAVKGWPVHSLRWTLILKELKRFTSSSVYMLNAGLGLLLMPVAGVLLLLKQEEVIATLAMLPMSIDTGVLVALVIAFMASTVLFTAPSVSLEGKYIWLAHSLPVSEGDCLLAKVHTQVLLTTPPSLLTGLMLLLFLKPAPALWPLILLAGPIYSLLFGLLGLMLNLFFPNLNWTSEVQPIKQGLSVLLTMLASMVVLALPALLYVYLFSRLLSAALFAYLWLLAVLLLSWGLSQWVRTKGAAIFRKL